MNPDTITSSRGAGMSAVTAQEATEVATAVWTITPAMAMELLATSPGNRPEGKKVKQYAIDMLADNWQLGSGAILLDSDMRLRDGHHRCRACILANKPFRTIVVTGVSEAAVDNTDTGKPRTLKDVLHLHGYTGAGDIAAAINWAFQVEHGTYHTQTLRSTVPISAYLEWLAGNPGIAYSATVGAAVASRVRISRSLLSGLHYLGSKIDRDDANVFMDTLKTGIGLSERDVIYALRKWAESQSHMIHRPTQTYQSAITIKAYNYWREGREVSFLKWKPGGANAEAFPAINGLKILTYDPWVGKPGSV